MSRTDPLPTIVLVHDDIASGIGQRVADLARGDPRVFVVAAEDFDPAALEQFLAPVEANDRLLLVHVVGRLPDGRAPMPNAMAHALDALMDRYSGLRGVRQWLVQVVGLKWDEPELNLVAGVIADACRLRLGGALVVGREVGASVAQPEVEERIGCAEAVHTLRVCPRLESDLAEKPTPWLVGVAAVRYDVEAATRELARGRCRDLAARLAAVSEPNDPGWALGRRAAQDLELLDDREQSRLARSPAGGSVLSLVRAGTVIERAAFERIAVGDWAVALEAGIDELLTRSVTTSVQQVTRNVAKRHDELGNAIERAVLGHFEQSRSVASTEDFVSGMADALRDDRRALEVRRGETKPSGFDAELERLRRFAAHLPYAGAVMLRFLLLAVVGLLLVIWPLGPWLGFDLAQTRLAARVAAAAVAVLGAALYVHRWRRLVRARTAVLQRAEADAVQRIERFVFDRRLALLDGLLARLLASTSDSWRSRLRQLREAGEACAARLRDTQKPDGDDGAVSRYSLSLPLQPTRVAASHRDELDRAGADAERSLVEQLIADRLAVGSDFCDRAQMLVTRDYQPLVNPSLGQYLDSSPTARDEVRSVLGAELAPAGADSHGGSVFGRVVRYLCVPDGEEERANSLLQSSPDPFGEPVPVPPFAPTATYPTADEAFLALLHAYDATYVVQQRPSS